MRNLSYITTELPQFSPPSMRVRLEAFQRLFDACEIDRFEPRVKLNYEKDMITERDCYNIIETAKDEEREEGRDHGTTRKAE